MKEKIREFVLGMGVDDVGFTTVADYHSPRSPQVATLFPAAQSIVVMAYGETSGCESASPQIAMNGRLDVMEFTRSCNYRLSRFIQREFKAKAMDVSASYPMDMSLKTMGAIGEVSMRHAALSAGLGSLGRHNLIIHPKLGTRVVFTAVLTSLALSTDSPVQENPCTHCNQCVESCPASALNEEGKTDINKCLKNSQPYGLGANIRFWNKFIDSTPEEQKQMFKDVNFWRMYQAGFIGFQYFCFNCFKSCPIGQE